MKFWKALTVALMLFLLLILPASADTIDDLYNQQLDASGADELWDKLPDGTRELLDRLGINQFNADTFTKLQPKNVLDSLSELLKQQATDPLRAAGVLLGVVLLYALMNGMKETVKEETVSKVFGAICALTACAALIIPISGCIRSVSKAMDSTSVFMTSFVPVYAGVMLTAGQGVSAASYQTVVLFVAELISLAATKLIVPLMTVSLALGLTGSVTPDLKLGAAGGMINKVCGWLLGFTTTVFTGLLTLQGIVGAAADSLTGRAIRFSLNSFVPVVGSALSDAFYSVRGCLNLLKSTLGGFGILAVALIVLPPLLTCIVWLLTLSFCGMVAEMFSLESVASLFKTAQSVIKILIAVLAACSMFMIVATTIVTMAGGGT